MLASAFAEEAVIDFSPCGRKLGPDLEPLRGRASIVGFLAGTAAHQVTSHVIANVRTRVAEGRATLRALVGAPHVARSDSTRRFRMTNWYDAELGPYQGAWRLTQLLIDNVWFEGDPRTMLHR